MLQWYRGISHIDAMMPYHNNCDNRLQMSSWLLIGIWCLDSYPGFIITPFLFWYEPLIVWAEDDSLLSRGVLSWKHILAIEPMIAPQSWMKRAHWSRDPFSAQPPLRAPPLPLMPLPLHLYLLLLILREWGSPAHQTVLSPKVEYYKLCLSL